MPPKKVEEAFYPPENLRRAEKELPDFFQIHQRMMAMETPDLAFQWLEYKKEHPNGYQLSQFYKLYRDFLREIRTGFRIYASRTNPRRADVY